MPEKMVVIGGGAWKLRHFLQTCTKKLTKWNVKVSVEIGRI